MMTDPISDMLSRIRNALMAHHEAVEIPASRIKAEIAGVLKAEGYIRDYKLLGEGAKKSLRVELKYTPERAPVIQRIYRVSSPGCRIYVKKDEIPRVGGGLGISILSTSRGVMTGREARRQGIGGEFICAVL